ncbi:relaxase/mobilization nuclease domain-containing protein [Microbacterium sp. TL13]|uniref:relaxase/mobilization nuclease domain-containing protein n=1 Tax=Microbacterium sp. TL13 TaxID=2576306 RepID=UPI00136C3B9A|nr:relaxase/mobilization nuclease domain-containing protein [Microbacterium sp. TL13]
MTYLVGPGKSNEHTEQHLVAGDSAVMAMYGYDSLDKAAALEIAASLDAPRREFGVDVTRQVTRVDPDTGETLKERVDASVWHCSLSIAADEGQLSDDKWGQIAQEFMDRMGFTEVSGKAACRWVAVRHGLSEHGNDHVHIAVSLVREDGTKASTHNDFHRAMKIVRELENEFELRPLRAEREQDMPQRQESRAARESAQRRGAAEVDSTRLERTVRAAASASMDEGEFVRRMRREGVLIRPRFETGRNDVVTGYSVALRPAKGAQPVWHSGLRLARDLTLPELRKGWPDTPENASAAVEEWRATRKNPDRYVPARPGREESEMNPEFFTMYAEDMTRLHEYIATIDPDDHAAWAHVARETSGAYAAWSRRLEPVPGPLARTSRTLARSAQLRPSQSRRRPVAMPSMVNTTALILAQASKGKNAAAEALLLRQLSQTTVSIFRAVQASGDARRASELAATVKNNLRAVRDGYAAQIAENGLASLTPEERAVKQRADLAAGRGGPLPTKLTPTAQPELAQRAPRTTGAGDRDAAER